MPQDKLPEPGEFTRIFKRQHFGQQSSADPEASSNEKSADSEAAETGSPQAAFQPSPQATQPAAAPAEEPGEFTRYFTGGLPVQAAKSGASPPPRAPAGVQRPNSPMPLRPLPADNSGSFTGRFASEPVAPAHKASEYGVNNPRIGPAPDLSKQPAPKESGRFDFRPQVPQPLPSSQEEPGEYTKLFGRGDAPPQPRQSAVAPAPLEPIMGDSPRVGNSAPPSASDVLAAPAQEGTSEFTAVVNGRQAAPGAASAPSAAGSAGVARKMPGNVNISPMNPLASMGAGGGLPSLSSSASMGMSGAHLNTPLGSASLQAPVIPQMNAPIKGMGLSRWSDQTKLILFFATLAILAVILVVALVVTQKS